MLFNSPHFLFVFLPAALALFHIARAFDRQVALAVLVIASLTFYAWAEPIWVIVLGIMLVANYFLAVALRCARSLPLLALALAFNVGLLCYVKYTNFVIDNLILLGAELEPGDVHLPIGVSFFVFQQVAYLVDSYRGEVVSHGFLRYAAFITFFPHFIAGPILFHKDILPQLDASHSQRPGRIDVQVGIGLFIIGLAKKLLLADQIEIFATPVFDAARDGQTIPFVEAWAASLAYAFQIYFDFSGYSDMAIGIAKLFGLHIPINFNSPYKATGIIEFWRCWHMSLSRFLRDYLYFPLGGNRKGRARRYINLMTVMLLGGIWHGAGWGFLLWGGLHGTYLIINHAWRSIAGPPSENVGRRLAARCLTFAAVVVAWVPFRAETLDGAARILVGMSGMNGWISESDDPSLFVGWFEVQWLMMLLILSWLPPNSQELLRGLRDSTAAGRLLIHPTLPWVTAGAILLLLSLPHIFVRRPFLYFQF